jgi:hypothetical protein
MDHGVPSSPAREAGYSLRAGLLFFGVAPLAVAVVETCLQFTVLPEGDPIIALGFAILFTVPGTFFAWLTTSLVARLPGADRLPVVMLLAIGFLGSLLIFRPYNMLVYEAVARAAPRMTEVATGQGEGHFSQSASRFLLVNGPGLLVWVALNLLFMGRFGFPLYGSSARTAPAVAGEAAGSARSELPEFCRAAGIADIADLWAVSAEDHYLRLHGSFGTRVIRQPFGAAIDQLPKASGLQVHRSHWVSFGRAVRIEPGKQIQIVLPDGTRIPVSSSYSKAVSLTETSLLSG